MAVNSGSNTVFRFLDLPGEQRNAIYCHLFNDITTLDQQFHIWEKNDRLPRYPFLTTYCALILTCHQINTEASSIFEKEYLPHLTLYFNDLLQLHALSDSATNNTLKQNGARFLLRSPTGHDGRCSFDFVPEMFGMDYRGVPHWTGLSNACDWLLAPGRTDLCVWKVDDEVVARRHLCEGVKY